MKIRVPRTKIDTLKILSIASIENSYENFLTTIPNFFVKSDFVVKCRKDASGSYYFYVFTKNNNCICYCEFINVNAIKDVLSMNIFKNMFTPHCETHPDYRLLGLVTNIYMFFITRCPYAAFTTDRQTKAAKHLWDRVAAKTKSELFYHNILNGKKENQPTVSNYKVMKPV